jgi:hypothetical protein
LFSSAFVIYKKSRAGKWVRVTNLEREFAGTLANSDEMTWLDFLIVPEDADTFEMDIDGQEYLIVKMDRVGMFAARAKQNFFG